MEYICLYYTVSPGQSDLLSNDHLIKTTIFSGTDCFFLLLMFNLLSQSDCLLIKTSDHYSEPQIKATTTIFISWTLCARVFALFYGPLSCLFKPVASKPSNEPGRAFLWPLVACVFVAHVVTLQWERLIILTRHVAWVCWYELWMALSDNRTIR